MKKYENGKYIEMTEEEVQELAALCHDTAAEPTLTERIEAIEAAILEGVLENG